MSSRQREMIVDVYKDSVEKKPDIKYRERIEEISKLTGIGRQTIVGTISEFKRTGRVSSPNRKRQKTSIFDRIGELDRSALKKKVHSFWLRREYPTIDKIMHAINEDPSLPDLKRTSLYRVIKNLDFIYIRCRRFNVLTEKDSTIIKRRRYMYDIRKYREEGRSIYYLSETCIHAKTCTETDSTSTIIKSENNESNDKIQTTLPTDLMEETYIPAQTHIVTVWDDTIVKLENNELDDRVQSAVPINPTNDTYVCSETSTESNWKNTVIKLENDEFVDKIRITVPTYTTDETSEHTETFSENDWENTVTKSGNNGIENTNLVTRSKNSKEKKRHLVVFHIGSEKGFLPNGLLCLEPKNDNSECLSEMNNDIFCSWFESIVPLLDPNSVIVLDNSLDFSSKRKKKIPTSVSKNAEIVEWLNAKGVTLDRPMLKPELLLEVHKATKSATNFIDKIAENAGHTVLRIPPYHCEFNPMESASAMVQGYVQESVAKFKTHDIKELLRVATERVTEENWKIFFQRAVEEENRMWEIDDNIDEMVDEIECDEAVVEETLSDSYDELL